MKYIYIYIARGHLRGLAALLHIAAFADGFWLFAGFTEVSMHQTAVTLPPASIFGILYAWRIESVENESISQQSHTDIYQNPNISNTLSYISCMKRLLLFLSWINLFIIYLINCLLYNMSEKAHFSPIWFYLVI